MTSVRHALRGAATTIPAARRPAEDRPKLRVLTEPELSARGKRRRARLLLGAIGTVIVGGLFGLAVFNVLLAQGQVRLNEIETRAAAEQSQYERLRLEVAQLQSPERVVAAAQERLGMVPPAVVTYLNPVGTSSSAADVPASAGSRLASTPVTSDWAQVKRHLAAQP